MPDRIIPRPRLGAGVPRRLAGARGACQAGSPGPRVRGWRPAPTRPTTAASTPDSSAARRAAPNGGTSDARPHLPRPRLSRRRGFYSVTINGLGLFITAGTDDEGQPYVSVNTEDMPPEYVYDEATGLPGTAARTKLRLTTQTTNGQHAAACRSSRYTSTTRSSTTRATTTRRRPRGRGQRAHRRYLRLRRPGRRQGV
jgi:hypothetical protein